MPDPAGYMGEEWVSCPGSPLLEADVLWQAPVGHRGVSCVPWRWDCHCHSHLYGNRPVSMVVRKVSSGASAGSNPSSTLSSLCDIRGVTQPFCALQYGGSKLGARSAGLKESTCENAGIRAGTVNAGNAEPGKQGRLVITSQGTCTVRSLGFTTLLPGGIQTPMPVLG